MPKEDNECRTFETEYFKLETTHFKADPESKFCFYHFCVDYPTGRYKEVVSELRKFMEKAISENESRRHSRNYDWLREKYEK